MKRFASLVLFITAIALVGCGSSADPKEEAAKAAAGSGQKGSTTLPEDR